MPPTIVSRQNAASFQSVLMSSEQRARDAISHHRNQPEQYMVAVHRWPPSSDSYSSPFVLNRRINVASVMFRFLFLIESLRFCAGLFV